MHYLYIIGEDEKQSLVGEFDDFYEAIETAEKLTKIQAFKLCDENENCIYGARETLSLFIYWRKNVPRGRGRDERFKRIFDKFAGLFHK